MKKKKHWSKRNNYYQKKQEENFYYKKKDEEESDNKNTDQKIKKKNDQTSYQKKNFKEDQNQYYKKEKESEYSKKPDYHTKEENYQSYKNRFRKKYQNDKYQNKKKNFQNTEPNYKKPQKKKFSKSKKRFLKDHCLICLDNIEIREKIWLCQSCKITTHLKCINEWLDLKKKKLQDKSQDFSCPHCNKIYQNQKPKHTCYCGKLPNPVLNEYLEPNSCGRTCNAYLNKYCPHKCNKICHSGKCLPCDKTSVFECYCGKAEISLFCRDFQKTDEKSCGKACGRKLNCGKHFCGKFCHDGDCEDCGEVFVKSCFCLKIEKSVGCDVELKCDSQCGRKLECGNHFCEKLCHNGECDTCLTKVKAFETCFCGKDTVVNLLGRERENCLEKIPSCETICNKITACGHKCIKKCHEGECDCGKKKNVFCQCGTHKIKIKCMIMKQQICKTICNRKKNCLNHICETICCPLKNIKNIKNTTNTHTCQITCNKELDCKKHNCLDNCHSGKCKPCDVLVSRAITCACGNKALRPPLLCGTEPPKCYLKCNKLLNCGHRCYYNCHFGECPGCEEILDKNCYCGRVMFNDVKCKKIPRCNIKCENVLKCGHKCDRTCHKDGECEEIRKDLKNTYFDNRNLNEDIVKFYNENNVLENSCLKICNKIRVNCSHLCRVICHEGDCPEIFCEYMIKIKCECRNLSEFIKCGSKTSGNYKVIECNDKCKNLKRFKALYDKEKEHKQLYYSESLVKYSKKHPKYLKKVEKKLKKMFFNAENKIKFKSDKSNSSKLNFILSLLSNHYNLDVSYYSTSKKNIIDGTQTPEFIIPKVTLSEYLKMLDKREINPKNRPFDLLIKFFNLTIHNSIRELKELLNGLEDYYYIERINEIVHLHVWKISHKDLFVKKLKSKNNNWSCFDIEEKKVIKKIEDRENDSEEEEQNEFDNESLANAEIDFSMKKKKSKKHEFAEKNIFNVFNND